MANGEAPKPEVLAHLKIPAFIPDDPEVWFQLVEWALEDVGVTSSSVKFRQVAKSLDGKYSREVRDLIINPPADRPYEKLKEELLRRLGQSQAQKIRQKTSQFLRHLKQLSGDNAAEEIVCARWMERINPLARTSIAVQATQPNITLEERAKTTDCVMDGLGAVAPLQRPAFAVSSKSEQSRLCELLERLTVRLDERSREINELRAEVRGRSRFRDGGNARRRSRSRSKNRYGGLCFFHHKFGAKAHRCERPCNYTGGNSTSGNE